MRRLLIAAAQQTELDRRPEPSEGSAPDGEPGASEFEQRVDRYFESDPDASAHSEAPEAYVTRRFAWLHDLVRANAQGQAPIDRVLETIGKLQLHLQSVASAVASGRAQLVTGESPEIKEAKALVGQLPPVVSRWLKALVQGSADHSANRARALLNNVWTAEVLPFCREAINDRYPFVGGSARETTLFDFGRLLGPGGLIESFFKEHLLTLVDTSRSTWRWTDASIGIPLSVLAQFQRATVIREAFFISGAKTPQVSFDMKPVRMDAQVTQFLLDLGGQIVDYRHGPLRSQALKWPAPEGIERVRLVFVDRTGSGPSVTAEGPWAWFKILDRSALRATSQPEKFLVTFSLAGLSAQFELRANSVRNPFKLDEIRAFDCPARL